MNAFLALLMFFSLPALSASIQARGPGGQTLDKVVFGQEFFVKVKGLGAFQTVHINVQYNSFFLGKYKAGISKRSNEEGAATVSSAELWQLRPNDNIEPDIQSNHYRITANDQVLDLEEVSFNPKVTVEKKDLAVDGYAGIWFKSNSSEADKVIIVLSGSEGGANSLFALKLANEGYNALALPYFGFKGLPNALERIPLEFVEPSLKAIKAAYPQKKIYIMGPSRGSELSLLLASKYREIQGVIGIVPSHYVWGANTENFKTRSAWTWRGEDIPFNQGKGDFDLITTEDGVRAYSNRGVFERGLEGVAIQNRHAVELKNINGPVLLIGGEDDQVWPSCDFIDEAKKILAPLNRDSEFACFAEAGHGFGLPGMSTIQRTVFQPYMGIQLAFGGTARASGEMNQAGWQKVLSFLKGTDTLLGRWAAHK